MAGEELYNLVSSLMGKDTQAAIAAENPYYKGRDVSDAVGQMAMGLVAKDPTRYGMGETAAAAGLTGLISGLFGGAGNNYQQTLTDRFSRGAITGDPGGDLPGTLFTQQRNFGNLFAAAKAKETAEMDQARELQGLQSDAQIRKAAISHALKYPETAQEDLANLQRLGIQLPGMPVGALPPGGATPASPPGTIAAEVKDPRKEKLEAEMTRVKQLLPEELSEGVVPVSVQKDLRLEELKAQRVPLGAALDSINKEFAPQMDAAKTARKALDAEFTALNKAKAAYAEAETALATAGDTGGFGGFGATIQQGYKQAGGKLGNKGLEAQAAAASSLNLLKAKFMEHLRTLPGAVSDYDAQQLDNASIGTHKTPAENRAVLDMMKRLSKQAEEYATAKSNYLEIKQDVSDFGPRWMKYRDRKYSGALGDAAAAVASATPSQAPASQAAPNADLQAKILALKKAGIDPQAAKSLLGIR